MVISHIIECLGPETDRSGSPGVSLEKVERFFDEAQRHLQWQKKAEEDPSILILGESTKKAYESFIAVRNKIDDFFARSRLARFDRRFKELLNPSSEDYQKIALQDLSSSEPYALFPIAFVEKDRPLPLTEGINPAWEKAVKCFKEDVVNPIIGDKDNIDETEWRRINTLFMPYEMWHKNKPDTTVERLGIDLIRKILDGNFKSIIVELILKDKSFEDEFNAISSVDKLVRYCRYLHTFINNFVAFRDFYNLKEKAIFQAGTLYLDGRSCDLCIKVDNIDNHVTLANLSCIYLVYCDCIRRGGKERMTIAAAFTAGDSDQLIPGRHGVFYDRKGQDWDATIVRILEHPISIRQAFWSPYKQASKIIGEQLMKIAASRSRAMTEKIAQTTTTTGASALAEKSPAQKAFDVGKFAGIFAAIGLAIGFIGSIVTSIITGFLKLPWWQWPIVLIGIMLIISGPSMFIAWFKLKRRNLGPILDANGWAVNTRAKINIRFGTMLTQLAKLPEGSERSLTDPYADKKRPWRLYILIVILIIACIVLWKTGNLVKFFKW